MIFCEMILNNKIIIDFIAQCYQFRNLAWFTIGAKSTNKSESTVIFSVHPIVEKPFLYGGSHETFQSIWDWWIWPAFECKQTASTRFQTHLTEPTFRNRFENLSLIVSTV